MRELTVRILLFTGDRRCGLRWLGFCQLYPVGEEDQEQEQEDVFEPYVSIKFKLSDPFHLGPGEERFIENSFGAQI